MPIIKLPPFIEEIHGKMGDLVFRRGPNGKTIVSRAPKKKRPKSRKAQKALKARNAQQQQRMLAAHDYAHSAMNDPELRAYYQQEADQKGKSAYRLAFGHFFRIEDNKKK